MMEKQANLQLELFTQTKNAASSGTSRKVSSFFLARIWNYEKTILIIIAVIITGVVSFSLGVEKGKRLTLFKQAAPVTPIKQAAVEDRAVPQATQEQKKQQASPTQKEGYIIRLASYKIKTHAQKEAELLKKKGLEPLVLSKGIYTVLCVGNIPNKQTASSLLTELRKRYRDCYLARL